MKIAVVVTLAICVLVFLLLPNDSQAGKTKKGPLVTEKVGVKILFTPSFWEQFALARRFGVHVFSGFI